MSKPRPIFPGDTYLITRRTAGRQYLLKPSPELDRAIEFIFAYAALQTGVLLHALTVLSNHYHAVATDPKARLPEFLRIVHTLIAKYVNTTRNREGNVWDTRQTHIVRLNGNKSVFNSLVYTMLNPVSHQLVAHARSWPGLRVCWPAERAPVPRPRAYFSANGPTPDSLTLTLHRPPCYRELPDEKLAASIQKNAAKREEALREFLCAYAPHPRRAFLGRRAIRRQSPTSSPRTPSGHREPSRRVAADTPEMLAAALRRLKQFEADYETARVRRLENLPAIFPAGTYLYRHRHKVPCHPDPAT